MTLLLVLGIAAAFGVRALHRRHRTSQLLSELGEALGLAAEAQRCHWRLHRRYTGDLDELARLRRDLAPFINGSRHGRRTKWELGTTDDGQTFDLAILALPRRIRTRTLGYEHLLTAHGDHGRIAYDTFAPDERYLPRLRPAEAA